MKNHLLKPSKKVPFLLHMLAGIILIIFALSHFAFLRIYDNSRGSANPVFPFMSNGDLYCCAGIFEMVVSLICFYYPARYLTNLIIIGFVVVIVWYKIAFFFLGGIQCGCLGLLGRLFHVTKFEEKVIPDVALFFLVVSGASSWLVSVGKRLGRSFTISGSRIVVSLFYAILLLATTLGNQLSARTVDVQGEIDSAHYNPITGKIFTNDYVHAVFSVVISDNSWKICITNQIDKKRWVQLIWDGTNNYLFQPNGGNFYSHKPPVDDATLITISSSPVYDSLDQDDIGFSPLWLTYGFAPIAVVTNKTGVVELPLNWRGSRSSMQAYGYSWLIGNWVGSRFVDKIDVVRNRTLDLESNRELLRNSMDYPETLVSFNIRNESIRYRSQINDGFLEATYRCTKWYETNGLSIPCATEFKWYLPPAPTAKNDKPTYIASLTANSILISDKTEGFIESQTVGKRSYVHDYRYKKSNETRIFKYAEYEMQTGETFKSANDLELQAKAESWLIHGRKYGDFSNRRQILSWLLLATLIVPAIILVWRKQQTQKHEK